MSTNEKDLDSALERIVRSDRRLLSIRQQLWIAFKAGADYALGTVRTTLGETPVMDRKVTVCATCERACCWQGEFMCDHAEMSGTKDLTVLDLHTKARGENAEYWFKNPATGEIDQKLLASFRTATT